MAKLYSLILVGIALIFVARAEAAVSPVAVGIVPPVQFPPSDFSVTGVRASVIYGHHRDLYGLDIGAIGNVTDQSFVGVGLAGGFNYTKGMTTILGLQAAGITNINTNKTRVFGVQLAGGMNYNTAESSVSGLQVALLGNHSPHTSVYGVQMGLYNRARKVVGFQIGLVNVAQSLYGLQIGLINFHKDGVFAVSPILNIGF